MSGTENAGPGSANQGCGDEAFYGVANAIEHSPWPMAVLEGPLLVFRHVNAAFCRLFHRPVESIVGEACASALLNSGEWLEALSRVFDTGQGERHSQPMSAGSPGQFHALGLWPLISEGRTAGVIMQLTEAIEGHEHVVAMNEALILGAIRQNELAEAADCAREAAEAASSAKDRFMAVLSHELRTPLTPIVLAVRNLERNKGMPPDAAGALAMIQRNAEFQGRLIDDLLDFTSITHGKLVLELEEIDLRAVLAHAVEATVPGIEEKRQRLTLVLHEADHRTFGDATRLRQVFTNLLQNASKFTPPGGVISLRTRRSPAGMTVEVSDSGVGFETDAGERIFEAFIQASEAVTREFGGLGLGLSISRAIVQAHEGSLRAHSPGPGQGATFTVELPFSDEAN